MNFIEDTKRQIFEENSLNSKLQAEKNAEEIVLAIKAEIKRVLESNGSAKEIRGYVHQDNDGDFCKIYSSEVGVLKARFDEKAIVPLVSEKLRKLGLNSFSIKFQPYTESYSQKTTLFGKSVYKTRISENKVQIYVVVQW